MTTVDTASCTRGSSCTGSSSDLLDVVVSGAGEFGDSAGKGGLGIS